MSSTSTQGGSSDAQIQRRFRQLPYYSKRAPPAALKEHIPQDTFDKAQAYSRDKARFSLGRMLYDQAVSWTTVYAGAFRNCWGLSGRILKWAGLGVVAETSRRGLVSGRVGGILKMDNQFLIPHHP